MVRKNASAPGFTLVELLVGMAVLVLLLALLMSVVNITNSTVKHSSSQIDAMQQGRAAFDILNRTISQATLNTYWDYYNASDQRRTPANAAGFLPAKYDRASDLHFLISNNSPFGQAVYFQSPQAFSSRTQDAQTQGLLNACGYFVEFNDGKSYAPALFASEARPRYRLMQAIQPTEDLKVFTDQTSAWTNALAALKWPIASNVIALIVWPRLPASEDAAGTQISPDYQYDSRSASGVQEAQLPPMLQVTVVVIDEASALRLESGTTEPGAIRNALDGKFTDPSRYASDLADLESQLTAEHIGYHVLTSTIPLRESRWSTKL